MDSYREDLKKSIVENYLNGTLHRYNSIKKAFEEFMEQLPEELITDKIQNQINKISQMFEQHEKKFIQK